ncbi:MAG: SpoIIE family protein phosphatase, partial [Gammaproteobacteria bacterium]|nr:SpoIIE family protein phosphatase [Gammaproteobacteria bacterium]
VAIKEIRNAIKEKRSYEVILRNYRKDGTPFWNELSISPVRDDRGKLTHFIGVQSDVTELRQAEEERHALEIAKQIQLSLLPKESLQMKNVVITGTCLPALHIGGDYYDYFHSGDTIDVVIADVSGHSVGAALIMVEARSTLKAETAKPPGSKNKANGTADILFSLNNLLYEDLDRSDMFITMFYVKYHPITGQLNYSNAGHNRALLLRNNENSCIQLDAEGLILGVKTNVDFEEKITHLDKEDMLLLYTDGITEAQNKQEEFFGVTRLCSLFSAQRQEPPQAIINNILKEVETFCQLSKQNDDISMVVLKAI